MRAGRERNAVCSQSGVAWYHWSQFLPSVAGRKQRGGAKNTEKARCLKQTFS